MFEAAVFLCLKPQCLCYKLFLTFTRNIPRAAILSVLIVIVVYTLTNASYLAIMTKAELLQANAVAVVSHWQDRVGDHVSPSGAILGAANTFLFRATSSVRWDLCPLAVTRDNLLFALNSLLSFYLTSSLDMSKKFWSSFLCLIFLISFCWSRFERRAAKLDLLNGESNINRQVKKFS